MLDNFGDILNSLVLVVLGWHEVRMNTLANRLEQKSQDIKKDISQDIERVERRFERIEKKIDDIIKLLATLQIEAMSDGAYKNHSNDE